MDFGTCVADLKQKAVANGIPYQVADAALRDVRPNRRVIELDRSQPEFVQTFGQYLDKRISQQRIDRGLRLLDTPASLFRPAEAQDRKSVVEGKRLAARVDRGGRRYIKKKI